jgi:hypothetical protein
VLLLREKNDAPFNLFFSCLNNPIVSEEHVWTVACHSCYAATSPV